MSEEIKHADSAEPVVASPAPPVTPPTPASRPVRGGFMGGGLPTTLLFLIAFFMVSYGLGYMTARNEKLNTLVNGTALAGQQQQQPGRQSGLQDGAQVDKKFAVDQGRVKGDKNAKVTMYEFSDFECPFCGRFYTDTFKALDEKYIKTGKIKVVYKDYPLTSLHPHAQKAAEAARCAQEQGKFWEMHDKLFENQQQLTDENYKKWAGDIKLNTNQFNQCFDSAKYADAVKKDMAEGSEIGVEGTPSFIINGIAIVGAQPISEFEKLIESKLK
jgi:protein-disulfide isomerase